MSLKNVQCCSCRKGKQEAAERTELRIHKFRTSQKNKYKYKYDERNKHMGNMHNIHKLDKRKNENCRIKNDEISDPTKALEMMLIDCEKKRKRKRTCYQQGLC